jgi:NACalpha-BTF3-like transcription factor
VLLPVRPLDTEKIFATAGDEDDEEDDEEEDEEANAEDCITVAQCRAQFPDAFAALLADNPDLEPVLMSLGNQCYGEAGLSVPGVACE